jgi:hypothetical protein
VKIQQYQFQVSCLIIKLNDGFDLLLGYNWFNKHKTHIDYGSKACILHKGNKKNHNSKCSNKQKKDMPKDNMLLALQSKRAVRKDCTPILVQLNNLQNIASSSRLKNNLVGSLVNEYENIFQSIPVGLPLKKRWPISYH